MKTFFITALAVYLGAHLYAFIQLYNLLPPHLILRILLIALFVLGLVSPVLFFVAGEKIPFQPAAFLYKFGTSWMIAFLYVFMMVLLVDIFKLINKIVPMVSSESMRFIFKHNLTTFMVGFSALVVLLGWGHFRYHQKKRVHLTVTSDKITRPMRIVGISDLHLGYTISRHELARWVDMINAEKPDIVVIAGDLIDNQVRPLFRQNMQEELHRLHAPLGVYASTGNHEYISGIKNSTDFIQQAGITLLRDSSMEVGEITLIGREDHTSQRRQPLKKILHHTKPSSFTMVLDHQPLQLDEATGSGIDFQLSGHTHNGQVFPISLIPKKLFELAKGYKQIEDTHFYVSSGLGIWGGKFRIATRSDYLVLDLQPATKSGN